MALDGPNEIRQHFDCGSYPDLRDELVSLLKDLQLHGIRVAPSSRFRRYLEQLEAAITADGVTVPSGLNLDTWLRSLIEIDDLRFVVRTLTREPEVLGWNTRLQKALSGGVRRTDEKKHSPARDIQFELIVAGMFRDAGYEVALAEPDVVVTSTMPKFGIAAKRPRSIHKLARNIRDADKQIHNASRQGVIAIDLNCLIAPTDAHVVTDDFALAFNFVINTANQFIDRNAAQVRRLVGTDMTFGFAAHFAMPVFLVEPPRLGYARRLVFSNLCQLDDPRSRLISEAAAKMGKAQTVG